jgi:hypothetical protein
VNIAFRSQKVITVLSPRSARRLSEPSNAADVTGECLALGLPDPKVRSSLVSAAGSDEGGRPVNGAALRLDFKVTVGLRVITLLPSIDFNRGHCVY